MSNGPMVFDTNIFNLFLRCWSIKSADCKATVSYLYIYRLSIRFGRSNLPLLTTILFMKGTPNPLSVSYEVL